MSLNLPCLLGNIEQQYGSLPAIRPWEQGDKTLTWSELIGQVSTLAGVIKQLGLHPKDRYAILGKNSSTLASLLYAGYWTGCVPVPLNYRLSKFEIEQLLADFSPKVIFICEDFLHLVDADTAKRLNATLIAFDPVSQDSKSLNCTWLEELLKLASETPMHQPQDDDIAIILYTGGTTGPGKGVCLSHKNIVMNALQISNSMRTTKDDIYLHVSPMFHSTDLKATVVSMFGGSHVYVPEYATEKIVECIERENITILSLVPAVLIRFLQEADFEKHPLKSLRLISYGTSPMDTQWLRFCQEKLSHVGLHQCYGLTETSPYLSILDDEAHRYALEHRPELLRSAGRILPSTQVRFVNEERETLAPGSIGEIVVKGPQVCLGYLGRPEEAKRAFVEGWFFTGDIGKLDQDGFLHILERQKDMVKTGGENVYTQEVESVLLQHPWVSEVAVIGVKDARFGEALLALVVLKTQREGELELGRDPSQYSEHFIAFCRDHLGGYKIPRSYQFLTSLPRTAMGKINKVHLRTEFNRHNNS